jgi:hypothetical protein
MPSAHNKIIAAEAKAGLGPIGCMRLGRSRLWLDDHGWWVGIVEFQPSAWTRGSYLNVATSWLWHEDNPLAFSESWGDRPFYEYESDVQFTAAMRTLVAQARDEILRMRDRFASLELVASYLGTRDIGNIWCNYHAAIAFGLVGDAKMSAERFDAVLAAKHDVEWVATLKEKVRELIPLIGSSKEFRTTVSSMVARARVKARLNQLSRDSAFAP